MLEGIDKHPPDAILVWSGANVSEATFLAMACWWLVGRPEPLLRVALPERSDRQHVATQTPAELAGLFTAARVLTHSERAGLAEDFLRLQRETGLLRRWSQGRVLGVPLNRYDLLLVAGCPVEWTPAPHVVGAAMGRCDVHNLMSDLFFCSRLQVLIDAGAIEVLGRRERLREYAARLAHPCSGTHGLQ